ncbi:MAG: hypothetical protein ACYC4U_11225 [Pirellulaceae bacterium]
MPPKLYHFFVYRVPNTSARYDKRTPCGGVVIHAWTDLAAVDKAFRLAYQRYPTKPHQMIVLNAVRSRIRQRQAVMMERDWERAFRKFEELMTVS